MYLRCTPTVCGLAFVLRDGDAHRMTDLDGRIIAASHGYVPIKTAMKKEQVRERERYMRKTRLLAPVHVKTSSCRTPPIYGSSYHRQLQ